MDGWEEGRKHITVRKSKRIIYKYIKVYVTENIDQLISLVGTIQKVMCLSTVGENLG